VAILQVSDRRDRAHRMMLRLRSTLDVARSRSSVTAAAPSASASRVDALHPWLRLQRTIGNRALQNLVARDKEPTDARNAPAEAFVIPFDRKPLAAPGERVIFNAMFTDASPGDYKLEYTTNGGHFDGAAGAKTKTIVGLASGGVDFFVPSPWDGKSTVQVVMKVKKAADGAVIRTETWNFGLKTTVPTTIKQVETTGERGIPATYQYDLGPALPHRHAPYYQHQTILERFEPQKLANIVPADVNPEYLKAHALSSSDDISRHFVPADAGQNGTFTVDTNDRIYDQHGGTFDFRTLVANLVTPKDILVALPQIYEAQPGTTLGRYTITRILKADGTTWKVKKG
jgi:hypothetical protein